MYARATEGGAFAIAYHPALVKVQEEFPDCVVLAYLVGRTAWGRQLAPGPPLGDCLLARDMCGLEPK